MTLTRILFLSAAIPLFLGATSGDSGMRFEEIGEKAGARYPHHTRVFSGKAADTLRMFTSGGSAVAVGDYDNDGFYDIFLVDSDKGRTHHLLHNNGNMTFTDVTEKAGVGKGNDPEEICADALWFDYDNDGWVDLVVARFGTPILYHNEHNGTFKEIGARSGIAYDAYGLTRGAMGIDAARFRDDDTLGIAIGNFANQMNALYVAQRDALLFADEATKEGLGEPSQNLLKFGLFFFDYDLDGRLDVLTANGHLEPDISLAQPDQQYRQPAQLFWNRGDSLRSGFVVVPSEKCGSDLLRPIVGRGSAYADIDGDGDLDVVLTQIGGPPLLLRNEQHLSHHWIRLKLVGTKSNRDAIGAWLKARVGGRTLWRQVMPTRSYLSQSELPVTIGLGNLDKVDSLEIQWPSGVTQRVTPLIDRMTTVTESP